ncbi:hypothetical protein AB1Y20_000137 [Prymnesium parvum]|uniref:Integrase catalytic domain-containing protein n=1 Tax=Prymnesium parvum TaxID=97485 RepID=A0AB34K7B3_PRYPA
MARKPPAEPRSPRQVGLGLDTRSFLAPPPKPDVVRERAALKAAFQQQSEAFASRYRPGLLQRERKLAPKEHGGPQPPETLVFYSWWNEETPTPPELQRSGRAEAAHKRLQLQFHLPTGVFRLFLDGSKAPITLRIEHLDGAPVRAHDLFVGKRLDILGRPTTLRHADARTLVWIDAEGKRLLLRRERLLEELSKYHDVPKILHELGLHHLYLNRHSTPQRAVAAPSGGQANLQRLTEETAALEERLRSAEGGVGTWIAPAGDPDGSYLQWTAADGIVNRVQLDVRGVVVIPTFRDVADACPVTRTSTRASGQLVHRRFLHRSPASLRRLPQCTDAPDDWSAALKAVDGLPCDECLRSSADAQHSAASAPDVSSPGELVSYDIWSVSVPHVHGGQKLVLNFHDHFSKINKPYLIKSYDEAPACIELYLAWCSSQGVTVRHMHTDNGTTLCSQAVRALLAARGVHLTTISPHCARQNGVCERQWRTLAADARHLLAQACLPRSFWWYAMRHAATVAGMLPSSDDPSTTPWERWTANRPSVAHVRVWGCLVYVREPDPASKVHDRGVRCIYLGRSPTQPGFVCFDPQAGRVLVSPHCSFVEESFPGLVRRSSGGEAVVPDFAGDYDAAKAAATRGLSTDFHEPAPALIDPTIDPAHWTPCCVDGLGADNAGMHETDLPETAERDAHVRDPDTWRGRTRHGSNYIPAACVAGAASLRAPVVHFLLYLGSGRPRPGDFPSCAARYDIETVCVDSKIGGYAHDLADPDVAQILRDMAASPLCLGVLVSTPCNTFSAARFRDGEAPVLRDLEHPTGVPAPDGTLPVSVLRANAVTDNALSVASVAARRGAGVIIESPVPRSAGQHAIPGREQHASLWSYPAVVDAVREFDMSHIDMDQCMCGALSQKATRLMATPNLRDALFRHAAPLRCDGRHAHESIVGRRADGSFRSAGAEEYPPALNRVLSDVFATLLSSHSPLAAWSLAFPLSHLPPSASPGLAVAEVTAGGVAPTGEEFDCDSPSYKQTLSSAEAPFWRRAREEEIDNLQRHGVVELVPEDSLPSWNAGKQKAWEVIDTLWVNKRKRDETGKVCRFKARCTLRGDQQNSKASMAGLDLNSFAPTVRHSTFRLLCAGGCLRKARKRTLDVEAAFLQGIRENLPDVYARPPPTGGPPLTDERGVPLVWRLHRPLYGSADAARIWYQTIDKQLQSQGFFRSEYDPCYYYKVYSDGARIDMSVYVDDCWITDTAGARCDDELAVLSKAFALTITDAPDLFLGMNVRQHSPARLTLSTGRQISPSGI